MKFTAIKFTDLIPVFAFALLTGCATPERDPRLQAGARAADVMAARGQPARSWPEADGGRTLEYSSQPFGRTNWLVRLDANDRVVAIEDGLRPASREAIAPGMTVEEVARRLGRERTRQFFRLSGEDVWDWTVEPEMLGSYPRRFNVHFKDGRVLRWTYSTVFPDRRFFFDD